MTLPTVETSSLPRTIEELRTRLATLGIDVDQVKGIDVVVALGDGSLHAKVTSYALDPLGQRFLLVDDRGESDVATESRLLPIAALFG